MTDHRWALDRYWIDIVSSAANVTGLSDFRTISFETVRIGTRRYSGTLWFWSGEPAHGNLPNADAIGYFRRDYLHGFIRADFFDGIYALLRSERPVVLHFAEDNGSVWLLELLAFEEPVGEVDRSVPIPDLGFRDLIADLEATASDSA
jgi:hypothetical protein